MKKGFYLLSVILVMTMLLSACSGNKNQTSSTSKQVTVTLSDMYTVEQESQSTDDKVWHEILDEYQKANPNVKLSLTEMTQDNYATKIQAQATANDLPDVFQMKGSWANTFVSNNLVEPVDTLLDNSGIKDKYRQNIFKPVTVDGKIYGFPDQYAVTSLVFYNADMWKNIGYDTFPKTWSDILTAISKFKAKGITPFELGDKDNWAYESCILSLLGDRYTGTDWTNNIIDNNGKSKFTDTDFVNALKFTQQIAKAGMFNKDVTSIGNSQAEALYGEGKAAATIDGYWNVAYVATTATPAVRDATKLAILPGVDGGKGDPNTTSGGAGWFVSVSGKIKGGELDAANKLMMILTGTEYSTRLASEGGMIGAVNVGTVDTSKFPEVTQEYVNFVNGGIKMTPIYDIQMEGSVIDVMNTGMQSLLNGSMAPDTLASQIQAAQDKVTK
jgi:raffinose/stachyose/melibiose transport system substrate-binding protein